MLCFFNDINDLRETTIYGFIKKKVVVPVLKILFKILLESTFIKITDSAGVEIMLGHQT